jgi:hypothetical protein
MQGEMGGGKERKQFTEDFTDKSLLKYICAKIKIKQLHRILQIMSLNPLLWF